MPDWFESKGNRTLRRIASRIVMLIFLGMAGHALCAGNFDLFPTRTPFFSASELDFRYFIYSGYENTPDGGHRLVDRGNFGLVFPVLGYTPLYLSTGIAAATQLVMYPTPGGIFPVDNFYATLALYCDYNLSSTLTFRLYPIYHVSAHLADGTSDVQDLTSRIPVSSEMAKLEAAITPVHGVSLSLGYGRYYHVCAQKNLSDRADIDFQLSPLQEGVIQPYLTLSSQFIHMAGWHPGFNAELGTLFANIHHHGIGVGFRYFDQMCHGFYYRSREKGVGLQLNFVL